jgi:hypothetical protein
MSALRKHVWADLAFKLILVALAVLWMRVLPASEPNSSPTTVVLQNAKP